MSFKIEGIKNIYCIGIKGVGMTMLAQFLKMRGQLVSGSDIKDKFLTDQILRRMGIKVSSPFAQENVPLSAELIIYSSAFNPDNNVELAFIKKNPRLFKKIPVLSYAEALGEIFNQHRGIAVCGSHGKTTTTAWLGYVLKQAGKEPNVLVGSNVPQLKGSAISGTASYLLAEVDEYQNKLQYFRPWGVLLNNIDYDHPDFFKTPAAYYQAFKNFIKKIPARGWLVFNADNEQALKAALHCRGQAISYALKRKGARPRRLAPDYLASDWRQVGASQVFQLRYRGRSQGEFKISLWGEHNIYNALAVIAAARRLGLTWKAIKQYLASFRGTDRRAQILGRWRGALIIDDYAHHPEEIKNTLAGLRARWPHRRFITLFHPHTFTRTKALFSDFASSFSETDELIILDIYGSARERQGGVSSAQLAAAINRLNRRQGRRQPVSVVATIDRAVVALRPKLKPKTNLILMGAGDVFRVGSQLLKK